jgi:GH15 family glucan-1,4-alpha-glucosidase
VRPFTQPALFAAARRSLRQLIGSRGGRFGIVPSEDWPDEDPWTAPTAWTAWAFAALSRGSSPDGTPAARDVFADSHVPTDRRAALELLDRRAALELLADLRRAATVAGMLPERVDAHTGVPRSTTPLTWSHAFAVLALLELWPPNE